MLELEKIGPDFENLPIFPERVNTEFVRVIDQTTLEMRVWERGSGETYACGTGACATVSAAVVNGINNIPDIAFRPIADKDLIQRKGNAEFFIMITIKM